MIPGGYIILARRVFESELMDKPPLYFKLWVWMIARATRNRERGRLNRGQFLTSIAQMQEAMSYKVGYRKKVPTRDEIRSAYEAFTKATMITTTKTTRGMVVTILKYNEYQDPKNYEPHNEPHDEARPKPTVTPHDRQERERKENKKRIMSISPLSGESTPSPGDAPDLGESPEHEIVDSRTDRDRIKDHWAGLSEDLKPVYAEAVKALKLTRRTGKIADAVLLKILLTLDRYEPWKVRLGVQKYIDGEHNLKGRKEAYLFGIIRNVTQEEDQDGISDVQTSRTLLKGGNGSRSRDEARDMMVDYMEQLEAEVEQEAKSKAGVAGTGEHKPETAVFLEISAERVGPSDQDDAGGFAGVDGGRTVFKGRQAASDQEQRSAHVD